MKLKYNRIFIVGTAGSGKSTLAKQISVMTDLTHYGLDWIVYKDTKHWKIKYSDRIRDKKLKELLKKKNWIIEGVYVDDWIVPVIKKSDLIVILKLSKHSLMKRVFNRHIKNKLDKKGGSFKDLLFILKSTLYNSKHFLENKNISEKYNKKYIILRNDREINNFLNSLK